MLLSLSSFLFKSLELGFVCQKRLELVGTHICGHENSLPLSVVYDPS